MTNHFSLATDSFLLEAQINTTDSDIFDFPVAEIKNIEIRGPEYKKDYLAFTQWLKTNNINFCNVKIPHSSFEESKILQDNQFYFMEVNYKPYLTIGTQTYTIDSEISIELATKKDLPDLYNIIAHSFKHERFHKDPSIGDRLANQRYNFFLKQSFDEKNQAVYKFTYNYQTIGFFSVLYDLAQKSAHWLLTAIHQDYQAKGLGKKIWKAMVQFHTDQERLKKITTSISSQNIVVLNLYTSLGFRFESPATVYHWVKSKT